MMKNVKNVAIALDNITQVKIAIAGKNYTLGKFYAEAAAEKIQREKEKDHSPKKEGE